MAYTAMGLYNSEIARKKIDQNPLTYMYLLWHTSQIYL